MKKRLRHIAKEIVIWLYYIMRKVLPIRRKLFFFECSVGRNYTGNVRAIYEEMVKQGLDRNYTVVFSLENTKTKIPGNCKIVKKNSLKYLYTLAVAKVWVSDSRLPSFLKKREGATYIQTWHGTPLKKLGLDMTQVSMSDCQDIKEYQRLFIENTRSWDVLISQNPFSTETFRRCFDFKKKILEIGYPRNDILFCPNQAEKSEQIKKQLGIPLHKKVLLYAPTWRDNQFSGNGSYKFYTKLDFDLLKQSLQDEYVLIMKKHYLVRDKFDIEPYKGFVWEFDQEQEISELYLIADALITDYSSVMFDYSILKRPMYFYCFDLKEYKDELRGFYFDFINEAPGPIVQTTEELIHSIQTEDLKQYEQRYENFVRRFNCFDNGQASQKVIDLIEEIV